MTTYYHGSHKLFDKFDLSHVLEGDGKIKFGFGVYVTSKYESAVHYSASNKSASEHYEKTYRREDWGTIIVDAMKQCLQLKNEQSDEFKAATASY